MLLSYPIAGARNLKRNAPFTVMNVAGLTVGMNSWLGNFAYRIDVSSWPFVIAGSAAFVIAMATVGFRVVRAANVNPVETLRYE